MDLKKKITISWSGGKDSAYALYKVLQEGKYEVAHLHTIINSDTKRVGLHGVREELIERQAELMGFSLVKGYLDSSEDHGAYEKLVRNLYKTFREEGVTHVLFGDIFLEDLKLYREKLLAESGLIPLFPLWKLDSGQIVSDFLREGFKTVLCSVNNDCYKAGMLGKQIDDEFIFRLPSGVDACGENGEFHTFLIDGPLFREPVGIALGGEVKRKYSYKVLLNGVEETTESWFYFQDFLP